MRQTPLLKSVLELLKKKGGPCSVPDLQLQLSNLGLEPNKTSLYRLLEKLVAKGEIETVLLDNRTVYYELKREHHHHFVCESCETIQCLEDESLETRIHALEDNLAAQGLKIKAHQFSFTGQCAACQ